MSQRAFKTVFRTKTENKPLLFGVEASRRAQLMIWDAENTSLAIAVREVCHASGAGSF